MVLHCLTHDPTTDLMTADAAGLKLIPRHGGGVSAPERLTKPTEGSMLGGASKPVAIQGSRNKKQTDSVRT